jgi:imidazolonepropionase-like amidohydrolase
LNADILVVGGNSVQDLACLRDVQMVMKAGKVVVRKGASL